MWPQRWLGNAYSKLYWTFGRESFLLADADSVLGFGESKLLVAISKLHSAGALITFDKTRPRRYRLLDPRSMVLKSSGGMLETRVQQEEYTQLTFDSFRSLRGRISLESFCVYGSVARGDAKPSSDLDILVVSDEFEGSLASRIDSLSFVDEEVREEIAFLKDNGYNASVSIVPLRREEAEAEPILLLDLSSNAKIFYDQGGFLGRILDRLRAKLVLNGSKRVETKEGWFWDMKPDFKPGQEVQI